MQRTVVIGVRGTQYHQASNQLNQGHLRVGTSLKLVRERNNPHDQYAVLIQVRGTGANLGHVGREHAPKYSSLIDNGNIISAEVKQVYRRASGHVTIQCSVTYRDSHQALDAHNYIWHKEIPRVAGVYEIKSIKNNYCYIGSAIDMKTRAMQHERDLARGCHHNQGLQRVYRIFGASSFRFNILKICNLHSIRAEEYQELLDRRISGALLYNATNDGEGIPPPAQAITHPQHHLCRRKPSRIY